MLIRQSLVHTGFYRNHSRKPANTKSAPDYKFCNIAYEFMTVWHREPVVSERRRLILQVPI